MLGGTSSLNGMVYMRGTPADYDGWRARLRGWIIPACCPTPQGRGQERGENDFMARRPLKVSDSRFRSEIIDAVVEPPSRQVSAQRGLQRGYPGWSRLLPVDRRNGRR